MRKDRIKSILKYFLKSTRIEYDPPHDVATIYVIFDDEGREIDLDLDDDNKTLILYFGLQSYFFDYCLNKFDLTIDETEYIFEIYLRILKQKIDKYH